MRILLFAPLLAACATSPLVVEPQPAGYQQVLADQADHPNRTATAEDRAVHAAPVGAACGDTVLNDQLTSGGLRVTTYMPCWDYQDEAEHDHDRAVVTSHPQAQSRTEAAAEHQAAKGLAESEIVACAHIPVREREHSPFAHRRSIAEVMPQFEKGTLRGVRVVFKPVPGLSADWLREDIRCHQAHVALLGSIPDAMMQDPTLVQNAEVVVTDLGDHFAVTVRTDSADQAALALAKAQGKGPTESVADESAPAVK